MFFRDDSKRPVDQGHRQDKNKNDILAQGRIEREQRQKAKKQESVAFLLQRVMRGSLARRQFLNDMLQT